MRNAAFAAVIALGLVLLAFCFAVAFTQPHGERQLKNAYHPYSVEASIRDR